VETYPSIHPSIKFISGNKAQKNSETYTHKTQNADTEKDRRKHTTTLLIKTYYAANCRLRAM